MLASEPDGGMPRPPRVYPAAVAASRGPLGKPRGFLSCCCSQPGFPLPVFARSVSGTWSPQGHRWTKGEKSHCSVHRFLSIVVVPVPRAGSAEGSADGDYRAVRRGWTESLYPGVKMLWARSAAKSEKQDVDDDDFPHFHWVHDDVDMLAPD